MVTVCAWCDRLMGRNEPDEHDMVSHGICDACANRLVWQASPVLVVSRHHAGLVPVLSELLRGHPHIDVLVDRRTAERRTEHLDIDVDLDRRAHSDRRKSGSPLVLA
jgi:hypothetical protein